MLHSTASLIPLVLAAVLAISVTTDLLRRKIYNWVTFPGIAIALILNCVVSGASGLLMSFEGIAVGSVWLLLWFAALALKGGTSAGDVKLFWVVGAAMGPAFTGWTLLYSALAGGVLGIVYALRRGVLMHTVRNAALGAHVVTSVKSVESLKSMADQSKAGSMPTAPQIAIGALVTWAISHHWI